MTCSLLAGSKVFVGLDNRAQAGVRVIRHAFDSMGNTSHEAFRGLDVVWCNARMFNHVSVT